MALPAGSVTDVMSPGCAEVAWAMTVRSAPSPLLLLTVDAVGFPLLSDVTVVVLSGNMLIASMIETLGEAFALTRKAGVLPNTFLEVFSKVFAQGSPIFENYAKQIATGAYAPGFKAPLALKDMRLALLAGEALQVALPVVSLIRDQLEAAIAEGYDDLDWAVIAKLSADRAGL